MAGRDDNDGARSERSAGREVREGPRSARNIQSEREGPAKDGPTNARKIRSEFGTRVARSIICKNCGASDTIHFSPKDKHEAYCRKCAAELIDVNDPEAGIRKEQFLKCIECQQSFMTPHREAATFVCKDCRAGIHTKQENKLKDADRVGNAVVRVRRKPDSD